MSRARVSQIEQGTVSGHDVVARYAAALGGRLHQAIYFDDGDIAAIAWRSQFNLSGGHDGYAGEVGSAGRVRRFGGASCGTFRGFPRGW